MLSCDAVERWRGEPAAALARRHDLTVYAAAYLELAGRPRLPLATLDGDLRKAAKAQGVAV